mmetsp:Transcript_54924/g.97899  ORF Transcript_54924/g.97899 Transcript_54924/m.97899 type:complete len:268 (+) Transcript_54924:571-1374(+)
MTEESATPLALVQPDLTDLSTFFKYFSDFIFCHFLSQTTDPNCAAVLRLRCLWHRTIFAYPIRCQRLVLRKVHTDRHALDCLTGEGCSLVHGLCVEELHMAELAVLELIYLQADHFNLSCWLKEVDQVLFRGFDRNVSNPKRMSIRWLDAFWTVPATSGSLRFQFGIVGHLVHVCVVDLYLDTRKVLALLFHRLINIVRVLELHVCEVSPDMAITAADLDDFAAIFEEILKILFLRFLVNPADPNRLAALRFLWTASTPEAIARPRA